MKWVSSFYRFIAVCMVLGASIALQTGGNHTTFAVLAVFWLLMAFYEREERKL